MRKQSTVIENESNRLGDDIMTSNDASPRVDKKSAENSRIKFIFANYGYKIGIKKHKYLINDICELLNLLDE